jgi:hypothetical protein
LPVAIQLIDIVGSESSWSYKLRLISSLTFLTLESLTLIGARHATTRALRSPIYAARLLSSCLALVTRWWPPGVSPPEGGVPMSPTRSEFPADLLAGEPSFPRPASRKRPARVLITFCLGIAATLAWQSYGDRARGIIANLSPQLGWLAPQAALAQAAAATTAAVAATPSVDQQEFKAISLNLAAVRQRVDQLAAQVAAGQEQVTRDFTMKLQAAEQDILGKLPAALQQPAAAPARRSAVSSPAAPSR